MRPNFKRTAKFNVIWKMGDDLTVILDLFKSKEIYETFKSLSFSEQDEYIDKHPDMIFQHCLLECVYFKDREEALHYLYEYACVFEDFSSGDGYDFKMHHVPIEEADGVDDMFWLGHLACVELTYPLIVVSD